MLHFVQGYLILFLHDPWGNVNYLLDKISFLLVWQIEANLFLLKLQDFYQKLADEKNICDIKLVQWVGKIIKILSCFKSFVFHCSVAVLGPGKAVAFQMHAFKRVCLPPSRINDAASNRFSFSTFRTFHLNRFSEASSWPPYVRNKWFRTWLTNHLTPMFRHLSKFVCTGITKLSANTWLAFTFATDRVAELTYGSQ